MILDYIQSVDSPNNPYIALANKYTYLLFVNMTVSKVPIIKSKYSIGNNTCIENISTNIENNITENMLFMLTKV